MTAFPAPIGEPPAVQFFAPDRLSVDHAYQRQLESRASQKLVFAIASSWDWRLCVPLLVSERAEGLFILDGQHRWAAAKLRGDIPFLPCAVGRFGSLGEEALLFVAANRKRVAVNRIDLFRAAVAAGHEEEVAVERLVQEAGLAIAPHTNQHQYQPGQLGCTSTLLSLYRRPGPAILANALSIMAEAFEGEVLELASTIAVSIAWLLRHRADDFSRNALVAVLRTTTPGRWVRRPELANFASGEATARELARLLLARMSKGTSSPARAAPQKEPPSFEEQLAKVESGKAGIAPAFHPRKAMREQTLGGVGTAML